MLTIINWSIILGGINTENKNKKYTISKTGSYAATSNRSGQGTTSTLPHAPIASHSHKYSAVKNNKQRE